MANKTNNATVILALILLLQCFSISFLTNAYSQDMVTYLGRDLSVTRSGRLTDILDLGNGKYAILGTDHTLDWIPMGTPRYEIAFPDDKIDNDLGTGKYPFILIIDTVLHNKSIEKVFYIDKNKVENFRFIKHTGYPGSALGHIYISGDRASTNNAGYFIGKLDKNFINGDPTIFDWIYNVKAGGMMFTHQPWDVGGDGKVIFGEGTSYSTRWAAVRRLKADGTADVVPHWRVHFRANGTEVVDTIAPTDAVNSCTTIKIDGRGCIQSMNLTDYNLITPDGNGGWKKGKYPFDIFFKGEINGTWDISGQGGYNGYRKGTNPTGGIGSIAIDKRNNDMFIGFNFQSTLPSGLPDFEPAVMKMDKDGRLIWWSRMYTESSDPACVDKSKLFTSTPDQYVDGMTIDYVTNNLVVNARCHGNNVKNFWTSNNAFQKSFTGTNGNIHISWLGKLKLADGAFTAGTYVAGYNSKAPTGPKYTDPNLAGWVNHNNGIPNDLNTTRLHPNTLKVDKNGGVSVIGMGQRMVTTKNAYMEQDSIFDNAAPWSDFVRVFSPDFRYVNYSSIVHSSFVSGGQKYNGSDVILQGLIPLSKGALVVGYNKADPANVFTVDCRNVPLGWGQDGINGPTPFLAKLTGEIAPRYNNQTLPANPQLTTGGAHNNFNGLDQVYLPDGSTVSAFQTESSTNNLLWKVDLFNGDSIVGLHRNSAMIKWNAAGRKEWHIDFDYGYDAPLGHDHHYPVIDKPFAPGGDTRFRKIVVDSEGGIYLAGSVWGGPDSIAGQPKFLYPKSYMNDAHGGRCDSIPWPCFQKTGDANHLKRVALSFVLKYNSSGLFQWAKTYWGDKKSNQGGIDIATTNRGNVVGNDTLMVLVSVSSIANGISNGQLVGGIGKASYKTNGVQLKAVNNGFPGSPDNSGYNASDSYSLVKAFNRFFILKRNASTNLKVDGVGVTGGGANASDVYIYELNPITMIYYPRFTRINLTNTDLNVAWDDYNKNPGNLFLLPRASSDGKAAFYLVGTCLRGQPIGQKAEMTITGSNVSEPKRAIVIKEKSDTLSYIPFVMMLKENSTSILTRNLIYDGVTVKFEDQLYDLNKTAGKHNRAPEYGWDGMTALWAANSNSAGELYTMLYMKNASGDGYKGIVKINNTGNYYPSGSATAPAPNTGSTIMFFKTMPDGTTTYLTKPDKLTYGVTKPHKVNFDLSDNPTFVSVIGDDNAELKLGSITINGNKSGYVFAKMDKSNPKNWLYANTFRYWNSISYPAPGLSNPLKFCDNATVADLYNAVKPEIKPVNVHFYKRINDPGSANLVDMSMPLKNDSVYFTEQWWVNDSIMSKRIPVTVKIFKTPILNKSTIANCPTCQSLDKDGQIKLFGATADEGVVYWSKDRHFSSYEVGDTVQFVQSPTTDAIKKYYYKAVNGGKCHSATDSITITLMPSLKVTNDTICGAGQVTLKAKPVHWVKSGSVTTEVASAGTVRWYDAESGGTLLQTNVIALNGTSEYKPTLTDGQKKIFWAEVSAGTCGAYERFKVEAYSFATPVTTKTTSDMIICGQGSTVLKASSSENQAKVHWYADAACTNLIFQGDELEVPSQNPPLSRTYYAKASYNGRCEGNLIQTKVEWRLAAGIKAIEDDTICGAGTATLKATAVDPSQTISWYDSQTGETPIATGTTFSPAVTSNTTYYAEADNGICGKSPRIAIHVVVNELPSLSGVIYNSTLTNSIVTNVGVSFIDIKPAVNGKVNGYTLTGVLPVGLSFNSVTGEITGTASAIHSTTNYTLKALNECGNVSTNFSITINGNPPISLYYSPNTTVATKGINEINATPTSTGGAIVSYSISPALPTGMSFNTTTGIISGTPTVLLAQTAFTITATNTGGSTTGTFTLTVNDAAPSGLNYSPASQIATNGVTVINSTPSSTGGTVVSYSISPTLPTGMSFNTTTGIISGTPTVLLAQTTFTITATNTGGSTTGTFTLTVNDQAPAALNYSASPTVATKDVTAINASPTSTGGAVVSYSISSTLPTGMSFNTTTGIISGTPTVLLAQTAFTITATNTGGSTTGTFTLTVNDAAPSGLNYSPASQVATKGVTVVNSTPSSSGGAIVSYSISPALPTGMSFNSTTGIISGTPTVLLAQTAFTITATNTGGSTTGTFTLTVNDQAPAALNYSASPTVATKDVTAINASPTSTGGAVVSYSISPALPAGMNFNTTTGVISGTPTVLLAQTVFTITATNTGGSTTGTFTLTVNDQAPAALNYSASPTLATKGVTAINASPTSTGGAVVSYSISPTLPTGMSFNTTTGVISGTPTVLLAQTAFTITATNTGGSTTGTFTLTVNDPTPGTIIYNPSSIVATKGSTAISATPIDASTLSAFSISPTLPAGVSLNATTGVISGTPTVLLAQTTFTITATNTGGSTTGTFTLTVNDQAPAGLNYSASPTVATKDVTAINASPTSTGGAVISYSISPALPTGMSFNTTTGIISGTPTVLLAQTAFTITATNTGGSTTGTFTLTVNDAAPSGLNYSPASQIATKGVTVVNSTPSSSGGAIVSYSISPALPTGMSFNSTTGIISGTPTVLLAQTAFTITATNTGGSTTGTFTLTVNDPTPGTIIYNPSSIVATKGSTAISATPIDASTLSAFSISPTLPAGVSLNATTGVISGTPTILLAQTTFTITATNTGGSTTGTFTLTVNDATPSGLNYSPASQIATNGVTVINSTPSSTGGTVVSYSISPTLPTGMSFNTTTGVISGTPTTLLAQTTFTITATNSGGSTTGTFTLTVNDPSPGTIIYNPSSIVATKGSTAISATPIDASTLSAFSISPTLPAGVSLNATTGVISGTPTVLLAQTTFTITATNTGGSTTGTFTLTVNDVAPGGLNYSPTSQIATKGVTVVTSTPNSTGGTVVSYGISPTLPTGMSFNSTTGIISGTPTTLLAQTTFTITATNTGGSTTGTFTLTVSDQAPTTLNYSASPTVATKGVTAINASPTSTGGAVISYSISPALPTGMSFNTTTGVISGTPTTLLAQTTFTITATNTGGSTTGTFTLTVNHQAPGSFVFKPDTVVCLQNYTKVHLIPDHHGIKEGLAYSAKPNLPKGLTINTNTGIISGVCQEAFEKIKYEITAENTGGYSTTHITIESLAFSGFSYYPNPAIATLNESIEVKPTQYYGERTYTIEPALPSGLWMNTSTGAIEGIPSEVSDIQNYTIIGWGNLDTITCKLELLVRAPLITAATPQTLCFPASISDIKVSVPNGANARWWSEQSGGTMLSLATPLDSGMTYYVEAFFTEEERTSPRIAVLVNSAPPIQNRINSESEVFYEKDMTNIKVYTEEIERGSYIWSLPDGIEYEGIEFEFPVEQYLNSGKCVVNLKITNEFGCSTIISKDIWIIPSQIPNTFTPNADGINDLFMKGFMLEIYNRNGVKLFDGTAGWDGTYKGHIVSNGTYFYVVKYIVNESKKIKTGYVTVSRP